MKKWHSAVWTGVNALMDLIEDMKDLLNVLVLNEVDDDIDLRWWVRIPLIIVLFLSETAIIIVLLATLALALGFGIVSMGYLRKVEHE